VLRGASVFEGIRAYRSADGQDLLLFRLAEHFERLYNGSMRVLRMRIEFTAEQLTQGVIELLRANEVRDDAHVRVVAYFDVLDGAAKGDGDPTGAYILAFPKPLNARLESGVRSTISAWRRPSDSSISPRVKAHANYLNSRVALLDATSRASTSRPPQRAGQGCRRARARTSSWSAADASSPPASPMPSSKA